MSHTTISPEAVKGRVKHFDTLLKAVNNKQLKQGDSLSIKERVSGRSGGANWDVVPVSTVTLNGFDFVACKAVPTLALALRVEGQMTPEQFGADGTAKGDSLAIVRFLAVVNNQLWSAGRTYILDARETDTISDFVISNDNVSVSAYGAILQLDGSVANNGIIVNSTKGFSWLGGRTTNPLGVFTNGINLQGANKDTTIRDFDSDDSGQYHIVCGVTKTDSYDSLVIDNCKVRNLDRANNNKYSIGIELFPKVASKGLRVTNCYIEQVGKGTCFKIHQCDDSIISGNKFVRQSNDASSQSQCVMLGGRPTDPVTETKFFGNEIIDNNTSHGALFIGNNSVATYVYDNKISGAGSVIWIGNSLTNSKVANNEVGSIFSLSASTNNLKDVQIVGNTVDAINFKDGVSVAAPANLSGLIIKGNKKVRIFRLNNSGEAGVTKVTGNSFVDVDVLHIIDSDNVEYTNNTIEIAAQGNGSSQVISVNGDDWFQSGNIWRLKGLVSQSVHIKAGVAGAQLIGEKVENATTRLLLDHGADTEVFGNSLKLNGGSWGAV